MTANVANTAVNGNLNLNHNLSPWRSFGGFGLLALGICAGLVSSPRADAQIDEATTVAAPVVLPQYSTLTSTDDTIQASRLPVTYNGKAYYVDLTLALKAEVSSKGVVTIAVTPTSVASPALVVNSFKAGTYVGPANLYGGQLEIVVSGPSPLPNGGTSWTISTPTGASLYTYPDTAVWYVEPIADSPLATRLSAAKITSANYSYGVGANWASPTPLLGFQQVGNTLSISNFSNGSTDYSTPQDTITYTLQQ
jgi:hypothetical protein